MVTYLPSPMGNINRASSKNMSEPAIRKQLDIAQNEKNKLENAAKNIIDTVNIKQTAKPKTKIEVLGEKKLVTFNRLKEDTLEYGKAILNIDSNENVSGLWMHQDKTVDIPGLKLEPIDGINNYSKLTYKGAEFIIDTTKLVGPVDVDGKGPIVPVSNIVIHFDSAQDFEKRVLPDLRDNLNQMLDKFKNISANNKQMEQLVNDEIFNDIDVPRELSNFIDYDSQLRKFVLEDELENKINDFIKKEGQDVGTLYQSLSKGLEVLQNKIQKKLPGMRESITDLQEKNKDTIKSYQKQLENMKKTKAQEEYKQKQSEFKQMQFYMQMQQMNSMFD